ncbi:hypothetical protein Q8A67_025117 [Cirrhinus molitorella]|uniref:Uncharacterized protein n=1 Tax=Cirrhinus molitorella TaxID=172907 RepID=A0AA88THJ0_9TELE|nr:hypothetical protein Q8A67_025117 [Cirrhinus molitorella]
MKTTHSGAKEETGGASVDQIEGEDRRNLAQEEPGGTQAAAMKATHSGAKEETGGASVDQIEGEDRRNLAQEEPGGTQAAAMKATHSGDKEETGGASVDQTEGEDRRNLAQEEPRGTQAAAMKATHGGANEGNGSLKHTTLICDEATDGSCFVPKPVPVFDHKPYFTYAAVYCWNAHEAKIMASKLCTSVTSATEINGIADVLQVREENRVSHYVQRRCGPELLPS